MPIAFPAPPRGRSDAWAKNVAQRTALKIVPAPNMGNPNFAFNANSLGVGKIFPMANPRNPSVNFAIAFYQCNFEQTAQPLTDARRYLEEDGTLNTILSGVSRDSAGVALAGCTVDIFRSENNAFVVRTTSDGSGAWSVPINVSGPFFIREYKANAPDLAGTSANGLTATVSIQS